MINKKWPVVFLCLLMMISFSPVYAAPNETTEDTTPSLDIGAGAAVLMDADSKMVLYAKNADQKNYPASITKLMTALLSIENLSPQDTITFSADAVNSIEPGSNHLWMAEGEQITVDQALHGLLLSSANDVANGLGEAVSGSIPEFARLMNEKAAELGAKNTHFVNPNGLHDKDHYTTAYDMALIASALTTNDYFLQIMKDTKYQIPPTNKMKETRYLAQQHPMINPVKNPALFREDVIGGKTGFTNEARHTLVTMARRGDITLVAVVLKAEKDTIYKDTSKLLDFGFDSYTSQTLHTTDELLKTLPMYSVKSGQKYLAANCGISLASDAKVLLYRQIDPKEITLSFNLPDSVDPSAKVGDKIGTVDFVLHSKILSSSDLVIAKIDTQPEPAFSVIHQITTLPYYLYILIGLAGVFVILMIISVIKKRNSKRNRLKFKKMFK